LIPIKEVYSNKVAINEARYIPCPKCKCLARFYCDHEKDKIYGLYRVTEADREYPSCDCLNVIINEMIKRSVNV
jgi:hypothetical protein